MKLGIRGKLFVISLGLIAISVIVAYGYMQRAIADQVELGVARDLSVRAKLVARAASEQPAPPTDRARWDALADELGPIAGGRVTLIASDGSVLGDSELPLAGLDAVENHAARPEVREALARGHGESRRFSATVERRMLYVAEPFSRDGKLAGVARISLPLTQVDDAVGQLRRAVVIAVALALLVAVVMSSAAAEIASRTARSLTVVARRMAAGDLSLRTRPSSSTDELGELGRALDQLADSLSRSLSDLREERDRLRGILSGMQEGVLVLDDGGRVALINPALSEMLAMKADAIGKTPLEVIRHAELARLLEDAARTKTATRDELEIGSLEPKRLLVRAAPLGEGQRGVFAVFVDVTDIRRLETVRRDFVANVSHELRTPVTAIKSAAETLSGALASDPKSADRFVDIIERNAARLHHLVEDLLDLSRIESRKTELSPEPLALEPLFAQVAGMLADRAEHAGVRVICEPLPELPPAQADRRALEHVLTNLIDNAVKYSGRGAEVRITASRAGGQLRVEVRDTGPGIERKHLSRLFERFYRVDPGRSRELGGTGLGLSIVKNLVEAMGGSVFVESQLGAGATFGFTLPTATSH